MVVALQHDAKAAFADLLDHFIPIGKVLVDLAKIFIGIRVKSIIGGLVEHTDLRLLSRLLLAAARIKLHLLPFIYWEEVDSLVLKDLATLDLPEVRAQYLEGIVRRHGEPLILVRRRRAILFVPQ